jgi:hypothetical protein
LPDPTDTHTRCSHIYIDLHLARTNGQKLLLAASEIVLGNFPEREKCARIRVLHVSKVKVASVSFFGSLHQTSF